MPHYLRKHGRQKMSPLRDLRDKKKGVCSKPAPAIVVEILRRFPTAGSVDAQNIALSALRKTKRMSREKAAAKMIVTAGRALCFQNLALFFVDEVFVTVRLVFQER